jgi:hypothetical protein
MITESQLAIYSLLDEAPRNLREVRYEYFVIIFLFKIFKYIRMSTVPKNLEL